MNVNINGNESSTDNLWSRSILGGFALLVVAVLVLLAGLVYTGSLTLATDSDAVVHARLVSSLSFMLAGLLWCGAAFLFTHWRRRYLAITCLFTGNGMALIIAGVAALPPFSQSGSTLIVISGMGFLLPAVASVIVAALMRRSRT